LVLIVVLILATNFFLVGNPVKSALAKDSRNERFKLVAHYRYYVDPTTLVLDVRSLNEAAPVDLLRGLFQSAEVFHDEAALFPRSFSLVQDRPYSIQVARTSIASVMTTAVGRVSPT